MPRVSIVMPAFNPGQTLVRSLRSVVNQSEKDWEMLIIDDGGEEDLKWVDHVDPRIARLRHTNRGISESRNVGVSASSAELIAFMDQDDAWAPKKLELQLEDIELWPDAAFWVTNFDWVSTEQRITGDARQPTFEGLLSDQHCCLSSMIVRRSSFEDAGRFDPEFRLMQDYDLFLRLSAISANAPRMAPMSLVDYYLHESNTSKDYLAGYLERTRLLHRYLSSGESRGDRATLDACARGLARSRQLYAAQAYDGLRVAVRNRSLGAAAIHGARAVRWDAKATASSLLGSLRRAFAKD